MCIRYRVLILLLLTAAAPARAQSVLTVVAGQPTGELASLGQAAEVRIRFSEEMVPIGRLPDQVAAPFFSIRPAVTGTFRWASPTLLVFTPDAKTPLPRATRYDVSIAAGATAVSGRTLGRPDWRPVAGVTVDLTLIEVQWHSARRAEGNGFYAWETERKEVEAGHFTVTTAADPVPLAVPVPAGGSFLIRAVAREGQYRSSTRLPFFAIGAGYTAWTRYDHNRIDLIPERDTYKPGETARLMIQSPWEQATALLTVVHDEEGHQAQASVVVK